MAVATDLDLVTAVRAPEPRRRSRFASKAWNATWPKLFAIAIVIAVW